MSNSIGYVTTYVQNSNGTYTCTLLSKQTGSSSTTNLSPSPTNQINCVGILNSNILISPNNSDQTIIMSQDNKYIFIPVNASNTLINQESILNYYLTTYTVLKYNINIPLQTNITSITQYISSGFTSNDTIYNSLNSSQSMLKFYYAMYLTGMNPPSVLVNGSTQSNILKIWNDIGYLGLTKYQYISQSLSVNSAYNPSILTFQKGNKIIPDNVCVTTDSQTIITSISSYDCRNVPNGTPYILGENIKNSQNCGSSSSCSSSLSFFLIIGLLLFSGIKIAQTIDNRNNNNNNNNNNDNNDNNDN
jgi:hypothetical protein